MSDLDAFLAECDDVISDWEGSTDSASWAADGSHERDTGGEYYGIDRVPLCPPWWREIVDWRGAQVDLEQALAVAERDLPSAPMRQLFGSYQQRRPLTPLAQQVADAVGARIRDDARGMAGTHNRGGTFDWEPPVLTLAEGDVIAIDLAGSPLQVTVVRATRLVDGSWSLELSTGWDDTPEAGAIETFLEGMPPAWAELTPDSLTVACAALHRSKHDGEGWTSYVDAATHAGPWSTPAEFVDAVTRYAHRLTGASERLTRMLGPLPGED